MSHPLEVEDLESQLPSGNSSHRDMLRTFQHLDNGFISVSYVYSRGRIDWKLFQVSHWLSRMDHDARAWTVFFLRNLLLTNVLVPSTRSTFSTRMSWRDPCGESLNPLTFYFDVERRVKRKMRVMAERNQSIEAPKSF